MKINPIYGDSIISMPSEAVLKYLPQASEAELKVLIFALSNRNSTFEEIERGTGLNKECITNALFKWKELGVISCVGLKRQKANAENKKTTDEKTADSESTKSEKSNLVLLPHDANRFTSDEINEFLEEDSKNKELIDFCQKAFERLLYVSESSSIVSFVKYYGLSVEYVMLIIRHLVDTYGKDISMRRIESEISKIYDKDITTYADLDEYYKALATAHSLEGRFKSLLGIGERKLTKKQKTLLEKWVSWGYGYDIIELAFEITADCADKFSIGYMDAVISNWKNDGCVTLEDAKAASEKFSEAAIKRTSKKKSKDENGGGSFETNNFFARALDNSYED